MLMLQTIMPSKEDNVVMKEVPDSMFDDEGKELIIKNTVWNEKCYADAKRNDTLIDMKKLRKCGMKVSRLQISSFRLVIFLLYRKKKKI